MLLRESNKKEEKADQMTVKVVTKLKKKTLRGKYPDVFYVPNQPAQCVHLFLILGVLDGQNVKLENKLL